MLETATIGERIVKVEKEEKKQRYRRPLFFVLLVAIIVVSWHLIALRFPPILLPGPYKVLNSLGFLISNGSFFNNFSISFYRVIVGFFLGVVIGVPLGIILGSNRFLSDLLEPLLPFINGVPAASWSLIAVIWFGLTNMTPIFVTMVVALPIIAINSWTGTKSVSAEHVEMARAYHCGFLDILLKVVLPSVLPFFFSGARIAFGFGWRVSVTAEALGSNSGVGYQILAASDLVMSDQVIAWTLGLILIMTLIEYGVIRPLEKHLFKWRKEALA